VGLITSHRTYLTITKTLKGRPRPDPGCSATDNDLKEREHLRDLSENGIIISISCEHGSKHLGFIKDGKFLV
jgi:uncharacterized protein YuzE